MQEGAPEVKLGHELGVAANPRPDLRPHTAAKPA